jgi:transposase
MAKLSWPLPSHLDDAALESLLYPPRNGSPTVSRSQPDWNALRKELITHKNLTLMLLWQEYKECDPEGYQYSQFCDLFRQSRKKLDFSMRQEHRAGEKCFIDYCGHVLVKNIQQAISDTERYRESQSALGLSDSICPPERAICSSA